MSTSLTLTSTATGWLVETPEDLATVLGAVAAYGYRGGIMGQPATDGTVTWVLELNPASGIGVTAIQMAKAAGARVFATGRGADKAAQAAE